MPVATAIARALVIALVALFVSLGDVSYGLAAGSIGSRELKDGGVRSRDIGAAGPVGPQGPAGAAGTIAGAAAGGDLSGEAIPRTGDTDSTLDLYELTATGNRPLCTR